MAKPIKDTPELFGKDAERFAKMIANPIAISEERKEEIRRSFEKFKNFKQS